MNNIRVTYLKVLGALFIALWMVPGMTSCNMGDGRQERAGRAADTSGTRIDPVKQQALNSYEERLIVVNQEIDNMKEHMITFSGEKKAEYLEALMDLENQYTEAIDNLDAFAEASEEDEEALKRELDESVTVLEDSVWQVEDRYKD